LTLFHDNSTTIQIKQSVLYIEDKSTVINFHLEMCTSGTEAKSRFPGQHIPFHLCCMMVFLFYFFVTNKINRVDSDIGLENGHLKD